MSDFQDLQKKAQAIRVSIIEMLTEAESGHPGGSLSVAEIITALYFSEMKLDPKKPLWDMRDRLVMSKGHGVPAVYAAMAHSGFFETSELLTLRKAGSRLQGHPDRVKLPGIEAPTGSLGQGLSIAQGLALASRLSGANWHTYCILGDGECQEGQVWETAMSAGKFNLGGHLTAILDYNHGQIDGPTEEVMDLEPVVDKWKSFNWEVQFVDGHKYEEVIPALKKARTSKGKPNIIIANTVKGKGVSFMEGQIGWHGKAPSKEQCDQALTEIREKLI